MSEQTERKIVFRDRPKPCAGDLRISWRISLLLLVLSSSRGKKASMAKLHVLNDAIRSEASLAKLKEMLDMVRPMLEWRLRVEPALSRAVDFLIGEKLAIWEASGGKMYIKLLPAGEIASEAIKQNVDLQGLDSEAAKFLAKNCSEAFINALIGFGKHKI
ncbi:hypothetical protein AAG614_10405 [Citromicrobium bathyomarinum]